MIPMEIDIVSAELCALGECALRPTTSKRWRCVWLLYKSRWGRKWGVSGERRVGVGSMWELLGGGGGAQRRVLVDREVREKARPHVALELLDVLAEQPHRTPRRQVRPTRPLPSTDCRVSYSYEDSQRHSLERSSTCRRTFRLLIAGDSFSSFWWKWCFTTF